MVLVISVTRARTESLAGLEAAGDEFFGCALFGLEASFACVVPPRGFKLAGRILLGRVASSTLACVDLPDGFWMLLRWNGSLAGFAIFALCSTADPCRSDVVKVVETASDLGSADNSTLKKIINC
jgi:hypothetical protein